MIIHRTVLGRKQYIGFFLHSAHHNMPPPRMVPPPPRVKFHSVTGALRNELYDPYVLGSRQMPSSAPVGILSTRLDISLPMYKDLARKAPPGGMRTTCERHNQEVQTAGTAGQCSLCTQ